MSVNYLNDAHADDRTLRELFAVDPSRSQRYVAQLADLRIDWSRQPVTDEVLDSLRSAARTAGVSERFQALAGGEPVNVTEGRAALHMALRAERDATFEVDGRNVMPEVHAELTRMGAFAEKVRANPEITDIVNIGIGGSDLGPAMAAEALVGEALPRLRAHFVSNIDASDIMSVLDKVQPKSTLFVIVSKTFGTLETLTNARVARQWVIDALGESAVKDHFVAVSTAAERVEEFGISADATFGFWDWVGGRYSLWSAVGLSVMLLVGPERFAELQAGARDVDAHMMETLVDDDRLDDNVVVTLALIGLLHRNVINRPSKAVIPYVHELRRFPAYLQQLDMESNGKSVTSAGVPVTGPTGPVIWGEPGTNSQHAFFQLLHQGTDVIPVDFIGVARPRHDLITQHDALFANLIAQAQALAFGRASHEEPHRNFDGNRPSTLILAEQLDARTLGQLIALYEHIVFIQGVMWGINSFDQWGVELGKELASALTPALSDAGSDIGGDADSATVATVQWYRAHKAR